MDVKKTMAWKIGPAIRTLYRQPKGHNVIVLSIIYIVIADRHVKGRQRSDTLQGTFKSSERTFMFGGGSDIFGTMSRILNITFT